MMNAYPVWAIGPPGYSKPLAGDLRIAVAFLP